MADDDDQEYLDGRYEKIAEKDIVHEGYLRIRASKGLPGLRPWLNRSVTPRQPRDETLPQAPSSRCHDQVVDHSTI